MPELHQFSRRCSLAEHLFDGIARYDVDHQKDQREHQPEGGQCEQETLEKMSRHSPLPPKNPPLWLLHLSFAAPRPMWIPKPFPLPEPAAKAEFLLLPHAAHPSPQR